jgi:hypothetical protein
MLLLLRGSPEVHPQKPAVGRIWNYSVKAEERKPSGSHQPWVPLLFRGTMNLLELAEYPFAARWVVEGGVWVDDRQLGHSNCGYHRLPEGSLAERHLSEWFPRRKG